MKTTTAYITTVFTILIAALFIVGILAETTTTNDPQKKYHPKYQSTPDYDFTVVERDALDLRIYRITDENGCQYIFITTPGMGGLTVVPNSCLNTHNGDK